jgi:hypothetical protein
VVLFGMLGSSYVLYTCHGFWQIDSLANVELQLFYDAVFWGLGICPFPTRIVHTITLISKVMQTIM